MEMASPLDFRGIQLPNGMDKPGFRDSVRVSFVKARISGGLAAVGLY